jgi:diguanylate cyclase (GGDEF)-like protein
MKKEQETAVLQKIVCKDCMMEERVKKLEMAYLSMRHDKAVLLMDNRRLKRELETDELTGLKKTRQFEKLCWKTIHNHDKKKKDPLPSTMNELREKGQEGYFVVFIDLDGLKMANDTPVELGGGHTAGDSLLRRLANTLQKRTRKDDLVVRLSENADEFGVCLTGTNYDEAERSIERIRHHFEEKAFSRFPVLSKHFASLGLKISFSFGIQEIFLEYTVEEIRNVITRADGIMHSHKERRKQDRRSMRKACEMQFS